MVNTAVRQIFTGTPQAQRELIDCLTSLLASLLIQPGKVWLVSPWVSDFDLIDNRNLEWRMIGPHWGGRQIRFSEVLADAVNQGCHLQLVTNNVQENDAFKQRLVDRINSASRGRFHHIKSERLHTKGLLAHIFFVKGSMNFTYSGTNVNEEHLTITLDSDEVSEARLEFEERYSGNQDQ
jgi:hypothetical protein